MSGGAPAPRVAVQVVHASPGRLRVKVPRHQFECEPLRTAASRLAAVPGVLDVRRNAAAHSILIQYDPAKANVTAMFAAVVSAGVTVTTPTGATTLQPPTLETVISGASARADRWVAERTGRRADLRTLVPVGFGVLALRELLAGRTVVVPWYALAWYAFDSFYKLRRNLPTSPDTKS